MNFSRHFFRFTPDDSGFCQCHQFPCPGGIGIVMCKRIERSRGRAGIARRTQTHVNRPENAFFGVCGQGIDKPLRQPGVINAGGQRRNAAGRTGVTVMNIINKQNIQIRRKSHFRTAGFSQQHERKRRLRKTAVTLFKAAQDNRTQSLQNGRYQIAQVLPQIFFIHQSLQKQYGAPEFFFTHETPHGVQRLFVVFRQFQQSFRFFPQIGRTGKSRKEGRT